MAFYIAAFLIVAGVALYVAAPLSGRLAARTGQSREELELAHWEHEHALAVQGLRELEFDREMGKLSDGDYASLRASLQARALTAMAAAERLREQERAVNLAAIAAKSKPRPAPEEFAGAPMASIPTSPDTTIPVAPSVSMVRRAVPASEPGPASRVRFCPQCGMRAPASGRFCGECGAQLRGDRIANRAS